MLNILQFNLILVDMEKSEFHSYINDDNEQYARDSHAHMFSSIKKSLNKEY